MAVLADPCIVVTWPKRPTGWLGIADAATGREYGPVTLRATFDVDPRGGVTADLLMIVNEDGGIQENHGPTLLTPDDKGYRVDTFRFSVVEMRTQVAS